MLRPERAWRVTIQTIDQNLHDREENVRIRIVEVRKSRTAEIDRQKCD